jgi:hypothetical protein
VKKEKKISIIKSKTNILEIPGGTLGSIVVPTLLPHPGQLNTIVNLSTWSSFLLLGLMSTSFTEYKDIKKNLTKKKQEYIRIK